MHFEIYRDAADEWRWRLRDQNGQVIANSGEGYSRLEECEYAIILVKQVSYSTPVEDLTQ